MIPAPLPDSTRYLSDWAILDVAAPGMPALGVRFGESKDKALGFEPTRPTGADLCGGAVA
jgi:hypothetical protein